MLRFKQIQHDSLLQLQEGINFEIMALLVKEQTKMLRPSNVFCKHSITEVYNTILLTFLKGISTEKGRAILDRFDLKQSL